MNCLKRQVLRDGETCCLGATLEAVGGLSRGRFETDGELNPEWAKHRREKEYTFSQICSGSKAVRNQSFKGN